MSTTETITAKKPASIRAIFILNVLKIVLAITLFVVFTVTGTQVGDVGPTIILYTLIAYVIIFAAMVMFILKRNMLGLRIAIALDFLASIPATAVAGLVIAIVSFVMTFRPSAKAYME